MPRIATAERAGVGTDGHPRPSEDHVVVLDDAVFVLDGATSADPGQPGGWYAEVLSRRLAKILCDAPDAALDALLGRAIAEVAAEHDLRPGFSPSSTVAIARWTPERVDALALADSPVAGFGRFGVDVLRDDRIARLRRRGLLQTGADVRRRRNVEDGFWVAEADPGAASYALLRSWPRSDVDAVVLASDGVSTGVDDYNLFSWLEMLAMIRADGPDAVLDAVRVAEERDPDGERWPRAKRHDDQALVLVDFAGSGGIQGLP